MSWSNPERNKARAHHKYTIEGAVEYFRDEQLEPVHADGPCPQCHTVCLHFKQVDKDDRIAMGIGGHRIALCLNCSTFVVVFARCASRKRKESDKTQRLKRLGLLTKKKDTMSDKEYGTLLQGWYKSNGWNY